MSFIKFLLFTLVLTFSYNLSAQSPYQTSWKKDRGYIATGAVVTGLGLYFRGKAPLFTPDELLTLDPNDINAFDRIATSNNSTSAGHASDVLWSTSHVLPFLFLANKRTRNDFGTLSAIYGEVFLINGGLTLLIKNTARRPRPFVFNSEVDIAGKLKPNAKTSFLSGHTSFTAANTFFVAQVFSDYFPDSKMKPLVWVLGAAIPAATGYFRVAAGKHYPTDVITGYLLGAATGILIPHWHKNKKRNKDVTFNMGYNSAYFSLRF